MAALTSAHVPGSVAVITTPVYGWKTLPRRSRLCIRRQTAAAKASAPALPMRLSLRSNVASRVQMRRLSQGFGAAVAEQVLLEQKPPNLGRVGQRREASVVPVPLKEHHSDPSKKGSVGAWIRRGRTRSPRR